MKVQSRREEGVNSFWGIPEAERDEEANLERGWETAYKLPLRANDG